MTTSATDQSQQAVKDNNIGVMFVRSDLDEYGLDPYEFRVYGHITRRTGGRVKGTAFSSVKKMAQACGMSTRKLQYALKVLCYAGLLRKENHSEYRTNVYMLNAPELWSAKENLSEIRKSVKEADSKESSKKETKSVRRKASIESKIQDVSDAENGFDNLLFRASANEHIVI